MEWINISEQSTLCDQTIGEAEIRKKTGVSVVGILRDDKLEPNPGPQFCLREKDLVAIIGSGQARQSFHQTFFDAEPSPGESLSQPA